MRIRTRKFSVFVLEIGDQPEANGSRVVEIDVVLDISGLGNLAGIEILGLRSQFQSLSKSILNVFNLQGEKLFAYDPSCDAATCRVLTTLSVDQVPVQANFFFCEDERLYKIVAEIEEGTVELAKG